MKFPAATPAEPLALSRSSAARDIVSDIELNAIENVNEANDRVVESDVRWRFVIDTSTL
jgi:D-arabinose 1-dehydrogenase-like Zn-dependent alcohol dehydrogenase